MWNSPHSCLLYFLVTDMLWTLCGIFLFKNKRAAMNVLNYWKIFEELIIL
jgi:hypothetical protein